ncbi:neutral zinc metallopeptidase [Nonomuraea typhae]|uniref:Neutral zinc metallopeptidase n=1 Tax=Nonomuraea typhae TaxID=2603600 RepID=A0ABW7YSF4_9ACTN
MKFRLITALACAATLCLGGTGAAASAYPVKQKVLTDNVLYRLGKLPKSTCEEPVVRPGNRGDAKHYIGTVMQCLEAAWETPLSETGVAFEGARLKFVTGSYCGIEARADSDSVYCHDPRAVVFKLGKTVLEDPSDLFLMYSTAARYANHVQRLTDIVYNVDSEAFYGSKAERAERLRRYNLQADCLAGVFVKSVSPLGGRSTRDWKYLLKLLQGDVAGHERLWGKTASVRAWLGRGYASGDPGSCNTWTASPAEVA